MVLTCPRPGESTLQRTLDSLQAAGFDPPLVWRDSGESRKQFVAWIAGVQSLMTKRPDADAYFLVEDDVVFCRNTRAVLGSWPDDPEKIAIVSPYTPSTYVIDAKGWHVESRGLFLCTGQSWLMPALTLRRVAGDLRHLLTSPSTLRGGDYLVGEWAKQNSMLTYFHVPSLGQHIGLGNSAVGGYVLDDSPRRKASDFLGEDFDASNL